MIIYRILFCDKILKEVTEVYMIDTRALWVFTEFYMDYCFLKLIEVETHKFCLQLPPIDLIIDLIKCDHDRNT